MKTIAYYKGYVAADIYFSGMKSEPCPYEVDSDEYFDWRKGFSKKADLEANKQFGVKDER